MHGHKLIKTDLTVYPATVFGVFAAFYLIRPFGVIEIPFDSLGDTDVERGLGPPAKLR